MTEGRLDGAEGFRVIKTMTYQIRKSILCLHSLEKIITLELEQCVDRLTGKLVVFFFLFSQLQKQIIDTDNGVENTAKLTEKLEKQKR